MTNYSIKIYIKIMITNTKNIKTLRISGKKPRGENIKRHVMFVFEALSFCKEIEK